MTEAQKEKQKAYRREWARNQRRNRTPEAAEAERARERDYRKEHHRKPDVLMARRARVRETMRRWRAKQSQEKREEIKAKQREGMRGYYHRPEVKAQRKMYRARPEVRAAHAARVQKRRSQLAALVGSYTGREWLDLVAKFDHWCLCCHKREPEIKLTADHVVPVVRGGTNYISNIQPLCQPCNSTKHDKTIDFR
jgi:5-methylcytosine-specific restriction endonuclease McrA